MAATSKTVTGGLTPAGDVPTLTASRYLANQALQELSFVGALLLVKHRLKSGILSFTKDLALTKNSLPGFRTLINNFLDFAGTVAPSLNKEGGAYRIGRMASEGLLTTIRVIRYLSNQALQELSFSGTVTTGTPGEEGVNRKGLLWPIGYLSYIKNTILNSGGIDFSGIATWYQSGGAAIAKSISGAFDFAGEIYEILIQKQHELAKGVELTFSGLITNKLISKLRVGTLTFEKYVTWRWDPYTGIERQRSADGILSFGGVPSYLLNLLKVGAITPAGKLIKAITWGTALPGPLDFVGNVVGYFSPSTLRYGAITPAGEVVMKRSIIMMSGGMTPSGLLGPKGITRRVTGSLSPAKEVEKSKELLYYGIINP